jgi:hypothetical protein
MFFVEGGVFLLFLGGFCVWLLLSDKIAARRRRREAKSFSAAVDRLHGQSISDLVKRFGPPREQFTGSTGRSLYVWRCPPLDGFPKIEGSAVVTLTVDSEGQVVAADWQRR